MGSIIDWLVCFSFMVSPQMSARIDAIRTSLSGEDAPTLFFQYGLLPKLRYSNGFDKLVLAGAPGGFSWIGFLFGSFIFAMVRNYKIFWLWGGLRFVAALLNVVLNPDSYGFFTFVADMVFAVLCGFWLPYARFHAQEVGVKEMPLGKAIVVTTVLGFIACSPAGLIEIYSAVMRG